MSFWLWGGLFAFLGGLLIGAVNFLLSRAVFRNRSMAYGLCFLLRQILQIGYLVGLYFLAPFTPWSGICLLVGGVLGLTLALSGSTWYLLRMTQEQNSKGTEQEEQNG